MEANDLFDLIYEQEIAGIVFQREGMFLRLC